MARIPFGIPLGNTTYTAAPVVLVPSYSGVKPLIEKPGLEPVVFCEIDLDWCANSYGVAPCTAAGAAGSQCYHSFSTCQDTANFSPTVKTVRFADLRPPPGVDAFPAIEGVTYAPTKLDPGRGLGERARITVTINDFADHDRSMDPYYSDRAYVAMDQGTFLGKLLARNKYYVGRPIRLKVGYLNKPFSWENFYTYHFVIDRITGPDRSGRYRVVAKDALKLADDDRSKVPTATQGKLAADLTAGATSLTLSGFETEYPDTGGTIRINDEFIAYASRSGTTLNGLTRAQWGSTADEHETDDSIQLCEVINGENVVDVVVKLFGYAKIAAAYWDQAQFDTEKSTWLSLHNLTRVIAEPTGIAQLIKEIVEQCQLNIYFKERTGKIVLKAIAPPNPNSTIDELNDVAHFMSGVQVSQHHDDRLSRVIIYYGKIDHSAGEEPDNYSVYVTADLGAESARQYNEEKTRKIYATWFSQANYGQAVQLGQRLLSKYRDSPINVRFELWAKDAYRYFTGDVIDINTEKIQSVTGAPQVRRMEIIAAKEVKTGSIVEYDARTIGGETDFTGRYAFVAPEGLPDYSSATAEQKARYSWVCKEDGTFDDGTEGYKLA